MTELLAKPLAPWASVPAQQRLEKLVASNQTTDVAGVVERTQHAIRAQVTGLESSVNLYAGSNLLSPNVAAAHASELVSRPALGWPGEKIQPGLDGIETLEVITAQQLRRAFQATYAEPRFLTATMANLAVYSAFTQPGDTIAVLAPEAGGHASHIEAGTAGVRGVNVVSLPYDPQQLDIDGAGLNEWVTAVRPTLILVGGSVIQFPTDLAPLREAADTVGARLVFDASHVAGLIAAGVFPNPLTEGADLLTFSTYKTLAGPAGGATVTNDQEVAERISHALYPVLSSNYDPARLAPLAIATAEAVAQEPAWAARTIEIGQALGAALEQRGFTLQGAQRGYTQTHQIVVDVTAYGGGTQVMRTLESQGVLAGAGRLATQSVGSEAAGLRLGTQEIVRRGATLVHVDLLADMLTAGITDQPLPVSAQEFMKSLGADLWGRQYGDA